MLKHLADTDSESKDDSDMSSSWSDEEDDEIGDQAAQALSPPNVEQHITNEIISRLNSLNNTIMEIFFVDDFMGGTNYLEIRNLRNISRAMLHNGL